MWRHGGVEVEVEMRRWELETSAWQPQSEGRRFSCACSDDAATRREAHDLAGR